MLRFLTFLCLNYAVVCIQSSSKESKLVAQEDYYKLISKPHQNACTILKRISGTWTSKCGFNDGEKLICMENLYRDMQNDTCLVYSFGLQDDWDFEVFLAKLGCKVHAYDPSTYWTRPENSYNVPNLHYHQIGIGLDNGDLPLKTQTGEEELLPVKTLKSLLKENGDWGKPISYLKMDVEGNEIWCLNQWLKSGVMQNVHQFGIEMHNVVIEKHNMKKTFKNMVNFIETIKEKYGLSLVATNPNLCQGKEFSYYPLHDLLFVKK